MKMQLRAASCLDWNALVALLRECFPDMSEGIISCYCREHRAGTELLFLDKALAGAVIMTPRTEQGVMWVEALAVSKRFRKHGLGKLLMDRVEHRTALAGFSSIGLATRQENTAAQRLYERCGYSRRPDPDSTDWLYVKTIEPAAHSLQVPAAGLWPVNLAANLYWRLAYRLTVTWPETARARIAGGRSAGARSAGARSAGARSAGAQSAGAQSAGSRSAGSRSAGSRSAGSRSAGGGTTGGGTAGARGAAADTSTAPAPAPAPASRTCDAGPLIEIGREVDNLPETPFKAENHLQEHPLFQPARIEETLRCMPRQHIEIRAVESAKQLSGCRYTRGERLLDVDPVAAFNQLEERPLWINVHHVQRFDRDYAAFLREYLGAVRAHVAEMQAGVSDAGCFLLLSSGSGVVHFHSDPDQSFLNQIRGSKTVHLYPATSVTEPDLEALAYSGDHDAVVYEPRYEDCAYPPLDVRAGESLFIPLYAPHRVTNHDSVSIALSIGFNTRKSLRRRKIHLVNRELRARGVPVKPYEQSALDPMKHWMHLGVRVRDKILSMAGP